MEMSKFFRTLEFALKPDLVIINWPDILKCCQVTGVGAIDYREKIRSWTNNEAKGYNCLFKYIMKNKEKMNRSIPSGIVKPDDLFQTYEKITKIACDEIF
uniref:Deoxynucleotide monophosphate kinase n=1 Tax=Strongyloides venezuelensis TaxID=75913 RepID=A0A0K0EZK7_STRVS